MNQDLQTLAEQAQQQLQQSQANVQLLTGIVITAIIICAIFSVLSFWKLCQIGSTLKKFQSKLTTYVAFAEGRIEHK